MQINPNILLELKEDAGTERTIRAIKYVNSRKVEFLNTEYNDKNNFELKANVNGTEKYVTFVSVQRGEIEDISCTCPDYKKHYGVCKHSLATVIAFNKLEEDEIKNKIDKEEKQAMDLESQEVKYRSFRQIVNNFYNEEVETIDDDKEEIVKSKGTINIEPKIIYDKFTNDMKIEFKIGDKRLYKLKSLSEFYDRMLNKGFYHYGDKLQFIHTRESFVEKDRPLLDFILKYAEIIKYANSNSNSNYRYYGNALSDNTIIVSNTGLDDLFEILKGREVKFQRDYTEEYIEFVDGNPNLEFNLNKDEVDYVIVPNQDVFKCNLLKGRRYKYILQQDRLCRLTKEFENTNLKLLQSFRQNYVTELHLKESDLSLLFSIVIPKVKNAIIMGNIDDKLIKKYTPENLQVKLFLDFDKNDYIIADVRFCYGNYEFNPLDEKNKPSVPRDIVKETQSFNIFRKTGFMFDVKNLRFILPDDDKIYNFLTNDITYYMQKFEVLVTDNFKSKEVVKPKIGSLGVKVENDLLTIDLSTIEFEIK